MSAILPTLLLIATVPYCVQNPKDETIAVVWDSLELQGTLPEYAYSALASRLPGQPSVQVEVTSGYNHEPGHKAFSQLDYANHTLSEMPDHAVRVVSAKARARYKRHCEIVYNCTKKEDFMHYSLPKEHCVCKAMPSQSFRCIQQPRRRN